VIKLIENILKLLKFLEKNNKNKLKLVFILTVVSGLFEILTLGSIIPLFNTVMNGADYQFFRFKINTEQFYVVFVLLVLLTASLRLMVLKKLIMVGHSCGADISKTIYEKFINAKYSKQIKINSSDLIASITSRSNTALYGGLMPLINMANALIIAVLILSYMIYVDAQATLILLLSMVLFYVIMLKKNKKKNKVLGKKISRYSQIIVQEVKQMRDAVRDIKLTSNQASFVNEYEKYENESKNALGEANYISNYPRVVLEALAIIIFLSLIVMNDNTDKLGEIVAIAFGAQKIIPLLQRIYSSMSSLVTSNQAIVEILKILDSRENNNESGEFDLNKKIDIQKFERMSIKTISFGYTRPLFKQLSVIISKGDKVLITGRTGTGKSTLLDILMGLIKPIEGCIEINGIPYKELNIKDWYRKIALVPQNVPIFDDTIEYNISFQKRKDRDTEKILKVIKQACLDNDLKNWDGGLDFRVGENGWKISGGQRQRIGIARALYKSPEILFLDESTSALDHQTESEIIQNVKQENITIIMISHRNVELEFNKVVNLNEFS